MFRALSFVLLEAPSLVDSIPFTDVTILRCLPIESNLACDQCKESSSSAY